VRKVEAGRLLGIDTDAVRENARMWRGRIAAYD
jgi:hypothetical protein